MSGRQPHGKIFYKNDTPNFGIQDPALFGEEKKLDISKNHLSPELVDQNFESSSVKTIIGEEESGVVKHSMGGLIITRKSIGEHIVDAFNSRQHKHIKNHSFAHKILCERKEEAVALVFLTLDDLLGKGKDKYVEFSPEALCKRILVNIHSIVESRLRWVINYSRHVIKDYYNIIPNRLKIKLNFLLDDGVYSCTSDSDHENTYGGLLLNNLLNELDFYSSNWSGLFGEDIGMICQVLCPSGLPKNKKWTQIDVGLSFSGKRLYTENMYDALMRTCRSQIHIQPTYDVAATGIINNKLYYGSRRDGTGYNGFEIHIWEVMYADQISIMEEADLNYNFCNCDKRSSIIDENTRNKPRK